MERLSHIALILHRKVEKCLYKSFKDHQKQHRGRQRKQKAYALKS